MRLGGDEGVGANARVPACEGVKEGGLAHVGQPDDSTGESHKGVITRRSEPRILSGTSPACEPSWKTRDLDRRDRAAQPLLEELDEVVDLLSVEGEAGDLVGEVG